MEKIKKIAYVALFLVFTLVFVASAVVVVDYFLESKQQSDVYDDLANRVHGSKTEPNETTANNQSTEPDITGSSLPDPTVPESTGPAPILPEYKELYEENNHLVGWITIPGTRVDYPVMQTPGQVDYYLKRNFYGDYSNHGCIYVREVCDVNKPSDNLTIYGHHMKDNTMFGDLLKYKKYSFWEDHKTVIFDTLTEHHTYEIIAVFKTSGTTGKGYPYHQFVDAQDAAEFDKFVADIKKMAMYDTGISAQYGDKLICLSTCEYSIDNGRFVVVAKRVS